MRRHLVKPSFHCAHTAPFIVDLHLIAVSSHSPTFLMENSSLLLLPFDLVVQLIAHLEWDDILALTMVRHNVFISVCC